MSRIAPRKFRTYGTTAVYFYDRWMPSRLDQDQHASSVKRTQLRRRIADAMSAAMVDKNVTARALSLRLAEIDPNVNEEKVFNYRRGATNLPLHLAQAVARELGMRDEHSSEEVVQYFGYDPLVMVRLHGLAPQDERHGALLRRLEQWAGPAADQALVARMVLLEALDADINERHQELAELWRDRGVPSLVRSIIETGTYGVAVWPVFDGPDGPSGLAHVCDRVDVRRLDGAPAVDGVVWADLRGVLARAKASPSIEMPRWPRADAGGDDDADAHVSMWTVRRLDAPRGPRVQQAHAGFPAIAISATVSNSWAGYVASFIAYALGYGLTSTTDVARHASEPMLFNPQTQPRNLVHDGLLRQPGERRVWYHAAKVDTENPMSPWMPPGSQAARGILHVRLVEDDELFESTAADRRRQPGFGRDATNSVADWRRSRDAALKSMPQNDWHLRLDVPDAEWNSPEKWELTVQLAIQVLDHLKQMGLRPSPGLSAILKAHARDEPTGAAPVLAWLAQRGAPFLR